MPIARLFRKKDVSSRGAGTPFDPTNVGRRPGSAREFVASVAAPAEADPLKLLWQQQRYAQIVQSADRWLKHPEGKQIVEQAREKLDAAMALVPEGVVCMSGTLDEQVPGQEQDSPVQPFLLDVYAVTNARFQHFVDAGCYEELELWPQDIWPHLIEMQDLTGHPGPRYWRQGRHNQQLANHPVVGVSWYEANAYAQWLGQRLPTEAEWQMAASWHIKSEADILRRFPWGDAMDQAKCNTWASRAGGIMPVDAYPTGAAPNGVQQLIGNVWEWTASPFEIQDSEGRAVMGEMPMRAIRGGAFDTYFEFQATSVFRSGLITLARTHNAGFRCAMDLPAA